jgi:hypothetical protein
MLKKGFEEKRGRAAAPGFKDFFMEEANLFLLFSLALILLLPYLVTKYLVPVYVVGRYTIVTFIPFVILFSGAAYKFAEKRLLWLSFIVFAAVYILPWFRAYTPDYTFSDRWRAEIILNKAKTGDIIMFAGLGRQGADYYFKRLKTAKRFTEFSFPSEIDEVHPCWSNFRQMDAAALDELGRRTGQVFGAMQEKGAQFWVVYENIPGINGIIQDKFRKAFHEKTVIRKPDGRYIIAVYEKN